MESSIRKINKCLMIGWTAIVLILAVAYMGELIKGERELGYILVFLGCTILPMLVCLRMYRKNPESESLKIYIVMGYFVMYFFSLMTTNTMLVFTYILPLVAFLILYHSPKLILWTGVVSMIINAIFIINSLVDRMINMENSRDYEIQVAVLAVSFAGCYVATIIYDRIHKRNLEYTEELMVKNKVAEQRTLQTIMTIVNSIESKDKYAKGHAKRVSQYTVLLAQDLGYSEEEVEQIRYVALLYDIGKISIPKEVLNKPGKLSDDEYALIKQHPVIGAEILKGIESPKGLEEAARYHHERYDGTGYPEGLKGEEIPMIARMIAIADAYDAMMSNRAYRHSLTDAQAEGELRRGIGTQFDPQLVDAFMKLIMKKRVTNILSQNEQEEDSEGDIANAVLRKFLGNAATDQQTEQRLDPLTMVYTKAYGQKVLREYLKNNDGCLLIIDIDSLRSVNVKHGISRGDIYLNTMVGLLNAAFPNKILYRSSGDEFMCFLSGIVNNEDAEDTVARLLAMLEQEKERDPMFLDLSISIGVAMTSVEGRDFYDLRAKADKALYFAKHKGGNNYCVYHALQEYQNKKTSRDDLAEFVEVIQNNADYTHAFQVNYPEFMRLVSYVKRVVARNNQSMKLILFTVSTKDENIISLEQKSEAMNNLNRAVVGSLRTIDVTTQYSSSQRMVALMNVNDDDVRVVATRIMDAFYNMNGMSLFTISYDAATINEER